MSSPYPLLDSVLPYGQRQCWYWFAGVLWASGITDAGHLDRILYFIAQSGATFTESTIVKLTSESQPLLAAAQLRHLREVHQR